MNWPFKSFFGKNGQSTNVVDSVPAEARALIPAPTFEDVALGTVRRDSSTISQGVPAFWFARALEPGQMASMWKPFAQSVWVQRAIKTISGPISAVKPDLYPRSSPNPTRNLNPRSRRAVQKKYPLGGRHVTRDAEAAVDNPQIDAFLREPATGLTYGDFMEATIGWLKMDECFWLLSDSTLAPFKNAASYKPDPVIVAQPYRMRHVIEGGELVGWVYTDLSGKSWNLLPEQVVQIKNWNPYLPWRGLGDYASASVAAEADWLAGKFNRNLMGNNGDTGPFIIAKQGLPTDPQRDQIISALREKRHAQLRGEFKPMFLTGDIDVQDPKISSVDAPFIASRIENRHEIAAAFGIPMSMFDIKAAYSIGADSDIFWLLTFTCIPTGAKICGALETLFQRLFSVDYEVLFDWESHPVMQAARRQRLKDADGLFAKGMPMEKVNEYLDLGLPEYDGWDTGYIAISLTPVSGSGAEEEPPAPAPTPDDFSEEPPPNPATDNQDQSEPVKEMLRILQERNRPGCCSAHLARSPQNEQLWKSHMRRRSGTIRLLQGKASKVFHEFRQRALQKLDATYARNARAATQHGPTVKSLVDVIFDPAHFGDVLNGALANPLQAGLTASVADLLTEIGQPDNPWTLPAPDALKFVKSRENRISGVGDTAFAQLKTQWEESVNKGENVDEFAARVKSTFNDLSRYESKRIAMTETTALDGFARHETMKGVGIKYKSWLSSHGPNVRPAHEAAEARYEAAPIPLHEPFIVMGEELMHPGDESGSPGNVINCQCIELAVAAPKQNSTEERSE